MWIVASSAAALATGARAASTAGGGAAGAALAVRPAGAHAANANRLNSAAATSAAPRGPPASLAQNGCIIAVLSFSGRTTPRVRENKSVSLYLLRVCGSYQVGQVPFGGLR